ncbi:Acetyl-coenzyme A synthetase [subsurface metagenome]
MTEEKKVGEEAIAVHWKEEEVIQPKEEFIRQANMRDPKIYERFSEENYPECFKEYGDMLSWDKHWTQTLDGSNPPFFKWFVGGKLNVCSNCVDRHLEKYGNKAAIIFAPEPEDEAYQFITYKELYRRVNEFAALLLDMGVKENDVVTFHMPMVAELPISMLACARIGAIHSEVFGGFSGKAVAERADDAESKVLITIDSYYRSGRLIDHKARADECVNKCEETKIEKVLIWERYPGKYSSQTPLVEGRDYLINDLLKNYRGRRVKPLSKPAEDVLFLMYTSGTTAKPKGCQHSIGGYLSYVAATSKYLFDIHPEDTYWCLADIGWITGHSYIVYGPLAIAATSVIFEGTPTYPDSGRSWRIAEDLDVNIFHTSPTMIRMIRREGPDEPEKYDYHFKLMCTVGEPIEPEVWRWYYEKVGKKEATIIDTWWQTENGGVIGSNLPALKPMKPGSCGIGMPGIYPVIFGEDGKEIEKGSGKAGNICIKRPWPGSFQTIWKDHDRYVDTYYRKYSNLESKDYRDYYYFAGDGSVEAADGYFRILGRIDDVINVAGHRLGTKEIESSSGTNEEVAESAVVAKKDPIKGTVVDLYVALKSGFEPSRELEEKIRNKVSTDIGPIARPNKVYIVPDMPKTRSGKIMRRVLAAISNKEDVGDVTSLANPEVVEVIKKRVQG